MSERNFYALANTCIVYCTLNRCRGRLVEIIIFFENRDRLIYIIIQKNVIVIKCSASNILEHCNIYICFQPYFIDGRYNKYILYKTVVSVYTLSNEYLTKIMQYDTNVVL